MFRIAMLVLSAVFLLLTVTMYADTEQAEDSNAAIDAAYPPSAKALAAPIPVSGSIVLSSEKEGRVSNGTVSP
jgi:hypothetical protein